MYKRQIQNSSEFGLTGGIHSLDPKEIELWRDKVEVGNAYINRPTTGAIVQRQPFGGWKNSCIGPGSKAGGPNYVSLFCKWTDTEDPKLRERIAQSISGWIKESCSDPDQQTRITAAAESCQYWWNREFSVVHDPSAIHGETNEFRYRKRPWHIVRVESVDDSTIESLLKIAVACRIADVDLQVSVNDSVDLESMLGSFASKWTRESNDAFCSRCKELTAGSISLFGAAKDIELHTVLSKQNISVSGVSVSNGRIQLLKFLREQSVTETVHRYGNIV